MVVNLPRIIGALFAHQLCKEITLHDAPVAQLDRALPSGGKGHPENGKSEQRTLCEEHDAMSCIIKIEVKKLKPPVAQLDRARPSGGRGQRFESSRVGHPPLFCPLLLLVTMS